MAGVSRDFQEAAQSRHRVLIVDDDASVLRTYALLMEKQRYAATAVKSSKEALAILAKESFDLILCDLALERRESGFDVIAAARQQRPEIPALLVTGYATPQVRGEAAKRGISVLCKPIEIPELLSAVAEMLGRSPVDRRPAC